MDVDRTRAFYQTALRIDQQCHCDGCRNYVRAVDTLPEAVLAFFSSLGIDPKKTPEVYVNDPDHNGQLLYGGFYHLCGTILSKPRTPADSGNQNYAPEFRITPEFCVSFHNGGSLLEDGFPEPSFQMEIDAVIPWVLEKDIHNISFDWRQL